MIRGLLATNDSASTTILRLMLGLVFFAHGAQKMLGWFGGFGFNGTMNFFASAMHIPAPLAFLAISAEFFGGIGLLAGFLTRIAAFGIGVNMLVAIMMVHHNFGFFPHHAEDLATGQRRSDTVSIRTGVRSHHKPVTRPNFL